MKYSLPMSRFLQTTGLVLSTRMEVDQETMNFERSGIEMIAEASRHFEDLIEYVKTTKRNGIPF